jgi:acetyl-CoA acetyltransferase
MAARSPWASAGCHRRDDPEHPVDELHRRQLRYGLATLCVGGGMGIATIVERV